MEFYIYNDRVSLSCSDFGVRGIEFVTLFIVVLNDFFKLFFSVAMIMHQITDFPPSVFVKLVLFVMT